MKKLIKGHVCSMLRHKSISQTAVIFSVTEKVMQHFIYRNDISPTEIKKEHARKTLIAMDMKYSVKEMMYKTGFSRNKVTRLIAEFGIWTKNSAKRNISKIKIEDLK